MSFHKRTQFWIDAPLQLQMLGYVLVLVTASLLLVSWSLLRGLEQAAAQSRQIFHPLDWIIDALRAPLILSSCLSILASALVTLLWSHRFAGPLRVLSAAIARLRQGNLTGQVRVRSTDTHQDLVKEFSQMQEDLRGLIATNKSRAAGAGHKLHEITEHLPKDHPVRKELQAVLHEIKTICTEFQI